MNTPVHTGSSLNLKSFGRFLTARTQRRELGVLAVIWIMLGFALHLLYPYPFSTPDSGAYLLGACQNQFNIYRPMGYSHYLQFIHRLNPSLHFIFFFTYTLHAVSVLLFLYTLKYLWHLTSRPLFYGLCICSIAAPRFLFSTNFIMSDSLFCSLAVLFVTTAVWLPFEKKGWVIALMLALFAALHQVRYSGMFYLPVAMYALWIAFDKSSRLKRTAWMLLPLVCSVLLHLQARQAYRQHTGINISSGFSGWQLINNASVLFPEAKSLPLSEFKTPALKTLHNFMQSVPDTAFAPKHTLNTSYMWDKTLPYKQFLFACMQHAGSNYGTTWTVCGELFAQYAGILIKHYPGAYFGRFILPSFASTFKPFDIHEEANPFAPDPQFSDYYEQIPDRYEFKFRLFRSLNAPRKIIHSLYWILLSLSAVYFGLRMKKNLRQDKARQIACCLFLMLLAHIGGSVLASPHTTWRYTMPIFLPSLACMLYALNDFIQTCKIRTKLLFKRKK